MGLALLGFGNNISFAQFDFDKFLKVEADVHENIGPVFVLTQSLALCVTVAFLWTEKVHLFIEFSIVRRVFGRRSEQVAYDVHDI